MRGALFLAGLALAAVRPVAAADVAPPLPTVVSATEIGIVKQNRFVNCRDGTYSAQVGRKSVWTFGDTCLAKGGVAGDTFIDNTLAWTTDLDASQGIWLNKDLKDSQGVPVRFIPFTAAELALSAQHAPNEIALWPGQLVDDPARNRVLVFYGSVWRGARIGFTPVGGGIAVADPSFTTVTRPVESLDPGAREPTYMWSGNEQEYGNGYVVVGDLLYCYGAETVGLSKHMHLARVPLADATDKTKWTYWNGTDWQAENRHLATVYVGGAAGDTIFWNAFLGEYMSVYQHYLDNTVYFRVADRPEGPWSKEGVLFVARQGDANDVSYAARVHPEMNGNGGESIYVTYAMTSGLFQQSLPIDRVVFAPLQR